VFTDLSGPAPQGLSLSAEIDSRFTTQPTALKLTAIVLAILSTAIACLPSGGWTASTAGRMPI
jgi:arabinosyltransferase B